MKTRTHSHEHIDIMTSPRHIKTVADRLLAELALRRLLAEHALALLADPLLAEHALALLADRLLAELALALLADRLALDLSWTGLGADAAAKKHATTWFMS